ncbi:hypothetical protein HO173_007675 [Letharia columbiana]|uniref:Uncharacterized protein n=1 Tax=Letharia columbiana TaxID=112416 RepID=A0A8H6FT81_9LECA|nr:uncharacterized protein HO173_007675 [Letharia columbiana]KAF6234254.1 hypothetical protein HO173_007675 [Letharia columbiana]
MIKTGMKARHRVEYDDEKDFITIEASRREPTSINRSLGDLLEEIIADLRSRNQCLTDLSGLLDGPAADADLDERRATPIVSFKISGTAEVWTRKAIDSFPKIDVTLAERLGEANWQRYQRVSKKLNGTIIEKEKIRDLGHPTIEKANISDRIQWVIYQLKYIRRKPSGC